MSRITVFTGEVDRDDPESDESFILLTTYDPGDPTSTSEAEKVLMRHFHLAAPPAVCSPAPVRESGFHQILRTWLFGE